MAVGERFKFVVKVRNVGTMGAGTVTNNWGAAATTLAPYITFTENIVTDEIIDRTYLQGGGMYGYS